MTASNSLGEQFKFYHGSDAEMEPGDHVYPSSHPAHPGHQTKWSGDFESLGHRHFVWMHANPEHTGMYGKNLYEVEPEGLTNRYSWNNGKSKSEMHVSLAPVKVVRRGKLAGPHPDNPGISKIEWDD